MKKSISIKKQAILIKNYRLRQRSWCYAKKIRNPWNKRWYQLFFLNCYSRPDRLVTMTGVLKQRQYSSKSGWLQMLKPEKYPTRLKKWMVARLMVAYWNDCITSERTHGYAGTYQKPTKYITKYRVLGSYSKKLLFSVSSCCQKIFLLHYS